MLNTVSFHLAGSPRALAGMNEMFDLTFVAVAWLAAEVTVIPLNDNHLSVVDLAPLCDVHNIRPSPQLPSGAAGDACRQNGAVYKSFMGSVHWDSRAESS